MIKQLDSITSNWIESSYSICSFSQVLEEAVYNSIDAGAKKIEIQYDLDLFNAQINDDGCGIPSDILKGFIGETRGVTDNFKNQHMFGFRGQFLASLCSMAQVEITSKFKQEFETYKKVLKHGKVISCFKALFMRTTGTTLFLTDLFHTIPVRKEQMINKKHLEIANCIKVIQAIAVIHPHIQFTLISKNIIQIQTHPHSQSKDDISAWKLSFSEVFGSDVAKYLTCIKQVEAEEYKLYGYFSEVEGLLEKSFQFLYINGRMYEDKKIKSTLKRIYQKIYFDKKKDALNPMYIFRIDSRIGYLDYFKLESLFWNLFGVDKHRDASVPMQSIAAPILHEPSSSILLDRTPSATTINLQLQLNSLLQETLENNQTFGALASHQHTQLLPQTTLTNVTIDRSELKLLRVVTQLDRRFIIATSSTAIYAFDQHAVDERIRLEALMQDILTNSQLPGILVEKKVLDVLQSYPIPNKQRFIIIQSNLNIFKNWFWEIEMEENCVQFKSIPVVCGVLLKVEDFLEFVEELESNPYKEFPKCILRIASYKACRSAVKFGDVLSTDQCQFMLETLAECKNPFICAHGRPSMTILCLLPKHS